MSKIISGKFLQKRLTCWILSLVFILFSFAPAFYELYQKKNLPANRVFVWEHNYMFDYNFYLSRIRQAYEGKWLVVEKYYNTPHSGSLLQILYLVIGKIGLLLKLTPSLSYHLSRFILGLAFLLIIGTVASRILAGKWGILAFILIVTTGSWPVLVKAGNFYRFATYMGWWSVIDSLQRLTTLPHVLFGQMLLFLLVYQYTLSSGKWQIREQIIGSISGLVMGLVFPPAVLILIVVLGVQSFLELITNFSNHQKMKSWITAKILPRLILTAVSAVSLIYLAFIVKVYPWKALAEFDVKHRFIMPYWDYFLALGPNALLAIAGMILVLYRFENKFIPFVSWIIGVILLFIVFENVPEQSALRFTESALHIPIGILATYFIYSIWQKIRASKVQLRRPLQFMLKSVISLNIIMGILVMLSNVLWLTDQVNAKRTGSFIVPTGAQIIYPLKDFMEGIYYLGDNSKVEDIVLAYETAGNFIPAYAGNFVYLGHANTPQEDEKKATAQKFFSGQMKAGEAEEFIKKENIKFVYFGPQEREFANSKDLPKIYPFLALIYQNSQVRVYTAQ